MEMIVKLSCISRRALLRCRAAAPAMPSRRHGGMETPNPTQTKGCRKEEGGCKETAVVKKKPPPKRRLQSGPQPSRRGAGRSTIRP